MRYTFSSRVDLVCARYDRAETVVIKNVPHLHSEREEEGVGGRWRGWVGGGGGGWEMSNRPNSKALILTLMVLSLPILYILLLKESTVSENKGEHWPNSRPMGLLEDMEQITPSPW